jgi:hypothetical protein
MCCGPNYACDAGSACRADNYRCGTCGGKGQVECVTPQGAAYCNPGLQETYKFTCDVCGGSGQVACYEGCKRGYGVRFTLVGGGYQPGDTCEPCGGSGQIACQSGSTFVCNAGFDVGDGYRCVTHSTSSPTPPPVPVPAPPPPVTQGGAGQNCYGSGTCNAGLFCLSGTCTSNPPGECNAAGEWCCVGTATATMSCSNSYDPGLRCNSGVCGH